MSALTATQATALQALANFGGTANSYRGTQGLNLNAVSALVRKGLVSQDTRACFCTNGQHSFEHSAVATGRSDDHTSYYRLTITEAGRKAL